MDSHGIKFAHFDVDAREKVCARALNTISGAAQANRAQTARGHLNPRTYVRAREYKANRISSICRSLLNGERVKCTQFRRLGMGSIIKMFSRIGAGEAHKHHATFAKHTHTHTYLTYYAAAVCGLVRSYGCSAVSHIVRPYPPKKNVLQF